MEGMNVNNDQRRRRHHRHHRSRPEMEEEVDNSQLEEFQEASWRDDHHHLMEEGQAEGREGSPGPGPVEDDGLPGSIMPTLDDEDVLEQVVTGIRSYYREKLTNLGKKNKSINRKLEEVEAENFKLKRRLEGAEGKLKLMRDILDHQEDLGQANLTLDDGAIPVATETGRMSPPPGEADEAISTRTFKDEEEDQDPLLDPSQFEKENEVTTGAGLGPGSANLNETFTSPGGLLQTLKASTPPPPTAPASSPVNENEGQGAAAASANAPTGIPEPDGQTDPNNGRTQADSNSNPPPAPPGPKFRLIKLNLNRQQLAALIQADRQRQMRQGTFRRLGVSSVGMRNGPAEMDRTGKRDLKDAPPNPTTTTKRQRSSEEYRSTAGAGHPSSSHLHHHVRGPGVDDGDRDEVRFLHSIDSVREAKEPGNFCTCSDTTYKSKGTLLAHIKYFNAEWKFVCPYCKKRFFSTGSLRMHLLKMHNKYMPVGVTGCSKCGQLFPSNREMAHHQRVIGCDASSG